MFHISESESDRLLPPAERARVRFGRRCKYDPNKADTVVKMRRSSTARKRRQRSRDRVDKKRIKESGCQDGVENSGIQEGTEVTDALPEDFMNFIGLIYFLYHMNAQLMLPMYTYVLFTHEIAFRN